MSKGLKGWTVIAAGVLCAACEPAPHMSWQADRVAAAREEAERVASGGLKAPAPKAYTAVAASALGTRPPGLGLAAGSVVPEFNVKTVEGKTFSSSTLASAGPTMLVFYRGGWCPYCNYQVRELAQRYPEIRREGVTPVMISADTLQAEGVTKRAFEVPFTILNDPDLAAHEAFHVTTRLDEANLARLHAAGVDVDAWSKRSQHEMAVPAVFIIARNGTVAWSHVSSDESVRPSVDELLQIISGLELERRHVDIPAATKRDGEGNSHDWWRQPEISPQQDLQREMLREQQRQEQRGLSPSDSSSDSKPQQNDERAPQGGDQTETR